MARQERRACACKVLIKFFFAAVANVVLVTKLFDNFTALLVS